MKRYISVIGVFSVLVYSISVHSYAAEENMCKKQYEKKYEAIEVASMDEIVYNDIDEYKDILNSKGTPHKVINEVSDSQLQYIALNLPEKAIYISMNSFFV